ncbi:hypothetical protein GCM10020254_48120 [Streptomyces goshikiensis]
MRLGGRDGGRPDPRGGPARRRTGEAPSLQAAFLELVGARGRDSGDSLEWLGGGAAAR